jgi:hypothetical protein
MGGGGWADEGIGTRACWPPGTHPSPRCPFARRLSSPKRTRSDLVAVARDEALTSPRAASPSPMVRPFADRPPKQPVFREPTHLRARPRSRGAAELAPDDPRAASGCSTLAATLAHWWDHAHRPRDFQAPPLARRRPRRDSGRPQSPARAKTQTARGAPTHPRTRPPVSEVASSPRRGGFPDRKCSEGR